MVLAGAAVESGVGANTVIIVEHLDDALGDTDVNLVLDVFIGNAVMHLVHRNVIIELYGCDFPDGAFVHGGGQRLQGMFLLIQKRAKPAAWPFLKGPVFVNRNVDHHANRKIDHLGISYAGYPRIR